MSYIPLPTDINSNVLTTVSQQDIFGQIVMASRVNQITAGFFKPNTSPTDFGTVVTTGGGTAASASGKALFQTGTAATASCSIVSQANITYTPGYEIFTIFSLTFTTPTDPTAANSSQYGGLWDTVAEGFYIGYNGTVFGTSVMTGGIQTFTPRASWNGDLLNGNPQSKFTRAGVPEAINFTYLNLFRIRFGWLGAAPVLYEVCSPDGEWVLFHSILEPNLSANPSIRNPDLPIAIKVTKTGSDSTNLAMSCACFAGGTAAPPAVDVVNYIQNTWTSSTATNTAITASALAAGDCSFSVIITGTVSAGVITFEATPDGVNWFLLHISDLYGTNPGVITTYNLASGSKTLSKSIAGFLNVRIRLSTPITGSGSVQAEIRPSGISATHIVQVLQPTGTNLHTVVDNVSLTGNAPAAVSVGITSTSVLAANASRNGAVFTNTSSHTISFGLSGNAAVLNSGITLSPNGTWVMDKFTFTTGAITAIASAASSNLAVQEFQ